MSAALPPGARRRADGAIELRSSKSAGSPATLVFAELTLGDLRAVARIPGPNTARAILAARCCGVTLATLAAAPARGWSAIRHILALRLADCPSNWEEMVDDLSLMLRCPPDAFDRLPVVEALRRHDSLARRIARFGWR